MAGIRGGGIGVTARSLAKGGSGGLQDATAGWPVRPIAPHGATLTRCRAGEPAPGAGAFMGQVVKPSDGLERIIELVPTTGSFSPCKESV
jgi:hypothetical protein